MLYLIIIVLVIAVLFGPAWWVRRVLSKYSKPADRYGGTGAELARHLLDELGLQDVLVEETDSGDHYDPTARAVRLTPDKFSGCSLTAVTVAAHEVGHAMQDRDGFGPLRWRTRMVRSAASAERVGAWMLMAAPFAGLLTRAPAATGLFAVGGLLSLGTATLVHMLTVPTEFDASFSRALPILTRGGYLKDGDEPHARRLLTAAALTYVAGAMMNLLNVGRWLVLLRR